MSGAVEWILFAPFLTFVRQLEDIIVFVSEKINR